MVVCVEVKFGVGDYCLFIRGFELFFSSSMCYEFIKLFWFFVDFEGLFFKYVCLELFLFSLLFDCRVLNVIVKFILVLMVMIWISSVVILLFVFWYKSGRFYFENWSNCYFWLDRVSWIYIFWIGKEDN